MDGFPRLREFLDAFLAPWHVAAAIALGSGGLLALRAYGVADLGALPGFVFGLVWVVFVYSGVVLLIRIAQAGESSFRQWLQKRERLRRINQNLDTLSQEEKNIFVFLLENNQRSIRARLAQPEPATLVQKGLLVRAAGTYSMMDWPHTVPDDVWDELVRRREEFR